jgi:hypothetical protein
MLVGIGRLPGRISSAYGEDDVSEPAVDLALAVVEALNGATWDIPFAATFVYSIEKELVTSDALAATVMIVDLDTENSTRKEDQETHTIGIALHQKVTSRNPDTITPLLNVRRQVHDFFRGKTLANGTVVKRRAKPVYDFDALRKRLQFIGFIELDFQLLYSPD